MFIDFETKLVCGKWVLGTYCRGHEVSFDIDADSECAFSIAAVVEQLIWWCRYAATIIAHSHMPDENIILSCPSVPEPVGTVCILHTRYRVSLGGDTGCYGLAPVGYEPVDPLIDPID